MYTGVTITKENYREVLEKEGRSGINFHAKHLAAYLKGYTQFAFGRQWDNILARYIPTYHPVQQQVFEVK